MAFSEYLDSVRGLDSFWEIDESLREAGYKLVSSSMDGYDEGTVTESSVFYNGENYIEVVNETNSWSDYDEISSVAEVFPTIKTVTVFSRTKPAAE